MNVLILTGTFGMGHISAAEAIRQEILAQEPDAVVKVVDVVETCSPSLRKPIYNWFNFTVNRCAGVYNLLNRLAAQYSYPPMKGVMIQKLESLLELNHTDLVISTLPLSSQYISAYKQTTGSTIPLYTYITDINAHNEWLTPCTDCYFVGDEETRCNLMQHGIPASRIVVSGIPVRQSFHTKPAARPLHRRRRVLIMGGGLGLIPHADKLLDDLAHARSVEVTVITGKNEALYKDLTRRYPTFQILGLTDRVADYMKQADLLITKAGGITTFEAIHTGTPLYVLRPFLMQEVDNARFVERHGLGRVVHSKTLSAESVLDLLHHPEELADMRQRMAVAVRSLDAMTALDRFYEERTDAAC